MPQDLAIESADISITRSSLLPLRTDARTLSDSMTLRTVTVFKPTEGAEGKTATRSTVHKTDQRLTQLDE